MRDKVIIVLFCIGIFSLTIWSMLKPSVSFSESENRYLAQEPKFSFESLFAGKFTSDYETYITDQFVFRDQWIGIKTQTELLCQKKDINGVYFCRDHYLMEKHTSETFGTELAASNEDTLVKFMEKYKEKLGAEHLQALLIPTASEVLSEKLPLFAAPYDQSILLNDLQEQIGSDYFLNGEDILKPHEEEYIYYRTDHHWTMNGAFLAYQAWAKRTGLTPYQAEDFNIKEATDQFYGTLESKVNVRQEADKILLYELKEPKTYRLTFDMSEDVRDSLYQMDALEGKDKYTVYMGGNYGIVEIDTNVDNDRALLVIKDSFAHSFVPLAVNHYAKTYMIDLRYFNMGIEEFMEKYSITDVLVLYNTANLATDRNISKIMR